MLKPIEDCKQHVVCFIDESTGLVETKYKKQTTKVKLAVGNEISITRDGTETIIKRISDTDYEVIRNLAA